MKRDRRIKLISAVICLAVSVVITLLLTAKTGSNEKMKAATLALCDIAPGTVLTETNIHSFFITESEYSLYTEALTYEEALGRSAGTQIFGGDAITAAKTAEATSAMKEFISNKERLVTVNMQGNSDVLSGYITAGDVVSAAVQDKEKDTLFVPDLLQYLKIHSIRDKENELISSIYLPDDVTEMECIKDEENDQPTSITFCVSEEQALMLIKAEKDGCLHMIFVGRGSYADELAKRAREGERDDS